MNKLTVVEHKGQKVLTTEQLAQVYETDVNNIRNNFDRNKDKFKVNTHYYLLKGEDLKEFKDHITESDVVDKRTAQLYLWTLRGANRHCKILDTDKAWQQFDVLEENYFKPKIQNPLPSTYKEALQQLIIELEEKERLQEANKIMKPKADYFDELVDRNLLTSFRDTAKEFKVKESFLINYLLENKYIYRDKKGKLKPYNDKNNGLFEVKETFNEKTNWSGTQTLITPKGRETFRLLLKSSLIEV